MDKARQLESDYVPGPPFYRRFKDPIRMKKEMA